MCDASWCSPTSARTHLRLLTVMQRSLPGGGDIMDRVVIVADLWTLVASEQMKAAAASTVGEEDPGPVLISGVPPSP